MNRMIQGLRRWCGNRVWHLKWWCRRVVIELTIFAENCRIWWYDFRACAAECAWRLIDRLPQRPPKSTVEKEPSSQPKGE